MNEIKTMQQLADLINGDDVYHLDLYSSIIDLNDWFDDQTERSNGICHDGYNVCEFRGEDAIVRKHNYTIEIEDSEGNHADTICKKDFFHSLEDAERYARGRMAELPGELTAEIFPEFGPSKIIKEYDQQ